MDIVYQACNLVQRLTLRLSADYEVTGKDNVPSTGPLLIVANHQSNSDPSVIGASVPRRTWFLAKHTLFRNYISSWFLTTYGAFPLDRSGGDIKAYRWLLNQLKNDKAVVVFPEGRRSNGTLQKASVGLVKFALKAQVPILPVGITGTERLGSVLRVLNPTGSIKVNIGDVFSIPYTGGPVNSERLEYFTNMVMYQIASLLPEQKRGIYATKNDSWRGKTCAGS